MRKIACLFAICLLITGASFAQTTTPSQVKKVTLFSDQALVTRQADVKIAAGLNMILLESAASNIEADSLQASVFGEGEVYSVQMKDVYLKEQPQENIKILQDKIKDLQEARRALTDREGVFNKKSMFLDSVVNFSNTQVPQEIKTSFPKTEDLQKTLIFLDDGYSAISKDKQALDLKVSELDKEILALERELSGLTGSNKSKKIIEIMFNSAKEQEVAIEATYLVYNASWQPLYKADVPLDLKEVNLMMFAKIRQMTGEDWKGVKLSISNVIPLKGAGTPSLSSWVLDVQRYMPQAAAMMEDKAMAFGGMVNRRKQAVYEKSDNVMEDAKAPAAKFVTAERKELPLSFEYDLPQALDIESRDKETILPVLSKSLSGKFFDFAVPQVSQMTFLLCRTASDKELLSAPLNVYFGGRFIGKTFMNEKKPGEDFDLNLGADRGVKVKREKLKDKVTETAFFGKIERLTLIREIAFKITVENLKEKAVSIKILDNIPVSRTDKIEVKDVKIDPEPSNRDYQDQKGVALWELALKPKEKKEINIEFTVTYPKDVAIEGLQF